VIAIDTYVELRFSTLINNDDTMDRWGLVDVIDIPVFETLLQDFINTTLLPVTPIYVHVTVNPV